MACCRHFDIALCAGRNVLGAECPRQVDQRAPAVEVCREECSGEVAITFEIQVLFHDTVHPLGNEESKFTHSVIDDYFALSLRLDYLPNHGYESSALCRT